jgi:hypothetical protein
MVYGSTNGQGVGIGIDQSGGPETIYGERESTLENFSKASAEATSKLVLMSKHLSEQEQILKNTRKQWKLMTGGIIGAFYSIAKLSPLFASYISEFGGVLGYVYDTAIIPWSDSIEGLLDIMWGGADAFDDSSTGIQKWTGALLIGVPVIAGLLVSLAGLAEILLMIAKGSFVAWLGTAIKAVGAFATGTVLPAFATFAAWLSSTTLLITGLTVKALALSVGMGVIVGALGVVTLDKFGVLTWFADLGKKLRNTEGWVGDLTAAFEKLLIPLAIVGDVMLGLTTSKTMHDVRVDIWDRLNMDDWALGSHATGATITQDGLYKLHQGERVTASTLTNNNAKSTNIITISPQITISGGVSSSIDARKLASDLSKYWLIDIQKAVGSSYK